MEYCINHPHKKIYSKCHHCGREFCEECLVEGKEYYYCLDPVCQISLKRETAELLIPESITCINCGSILELSEEERKYGRIHCPECEAMTDYRSSPPVVHKREYYAEFISSFNQGDIALIKSILEDANIDYYVFGVNFLSVDPLIQPAKFFVSRDSLSEAQELIKDLELHVWGFSKNDEAT